jgi:hypothetical protein
LSLFSGENVCTVDGQNSDNYVCFREDGSRYIGTPTLDAGNNVNPGFALGTLRLNLGYDRLFLDNILAGARLGFAFNGASGDGVAFLPVHVEIRGSYVIGRKPFERLGARPFVFLSGGVAQIDTKVEVNVLEDGNACGAANPNDINSPCTKPSKDSIVEKRQQTLEAYKQAGRGFISVGGGLSYAVLDRLAFNVALRASVTVPVVTFVLTPEAGISGSF